MNNTLQNCKSNIFFNKIKNSFFESEIMDYFETHKYEININYMRANGCTLLMMACKTNEYNVIKLLIENGADVNLSGNSRNSLDLACENGYLELIKLLISNGAYINPNYGTHPLYSAIKKNHCDLVKYLIECDADVNCVLQHNKSPLNLSITCNTPEITKLLIEFGANVNHVNNWGETYLLVLVGCFSRQYLQRIELEKIISIITLLLHNGVDVNAMTVSGYDVFKILQRKDFFAGKKQITKLLEDWRDNQRFMMTKSARNYKNE